MGCGCDGCKEKTRRLRSKSKTKGKGLALRKSKSTSSKMSKRKRQSKKNQKKVAHLSVGKKRNGKIPKQVNLVEVVRKVKVIAAQQRK